MVSIILGAIGASFNGLDYAIAGGRVPLLFFIASIGLIILGVMVNLFNLTLDALKIVVKHG